MPLTGLHFLLTYRCTMACDHCFVWGSPWQDDTFTLRQVKGILLQAKDISSVEWIYFEGGEPFLFYAVLLEGVREAEALGFQVGIVTNGFWATDIDDAHTCLQPFAGLIQDLSVSSDLYHGDEALDRQAEYACEAATKLDIPTDKISIAQPEGSLLTSTGGFVPPVETKVMFRGRAASNLTDGAVTRHWKTFQTCPYENLREPGRLHVDPLGYVHICQGITLGNLFETSLGELCARYNPDTHPVIGPLVEGGPSALVRRYRLSHEYNYADACHLCDTARHTLRVQFPNTLAPDQMYGVYDD